MGAWDELDTLITVDAETDDLDDIQNLDDPYGIFEDVIEYAGNLKEAVQTGCYKGADDLATRDRSFQEQALQKCKNPSGILASSINVEDNSSGGDHSEFLIGTDIQHIYPLSIEFGRGEVHPIPPKTRLRFYGEGGYLIYPLMAGKADPVPFVAPAYEKTVDISEKIMLLYIGNEMSKVK